ncbi:MAG: alpha-amylase family glycosyl hydrolase [Candidatus Gastranaerophilales bacterium]|nr:alpha-amylase family glycosyl hydrolase [Candidatus Gastranaerophilales bacterium]
MLKRIIIIILLIYAITINNTVIAHETIINNSVSNTVISPISKKLEKEIKNDIIKIYGTQKSDEIYTHIEKLAAKAKSNRPKDLIEEDKTRISDWYKDEIIYMLYIDQFGTIRNDRKNTFKDSIKMLDYLKDLGITTIYILPFADSPMNDAGFDVRDPQNVRSELGGITEFKEFATAAREKGFKLKADLVLNHFSDQHKWFQDALNGDLTKLDYFVVKEKMPQYTKYNDEKLGTVVEYTEDNGKTSKRRLIFPEISENHYRKVSIKGKDYFVYHTFYPFQPDINWEKPEVLYYCLETINYWANLGIDIFRMDAIPYCSKQEGTNGENLPKTHYIIKLLSSYLQSISPRSVMQAEACQTPKDIIPYFGSERKITTNIDDNDIELKRTDEVQICYHFPYMPALWASLITEDTKYFAEANKQTPSIPESASWATFLRVHDELTLEMVSPEIRELIYNALEPKGASFRKGFGVSGRMANFLDNDHDRIEMAFSILLTMPGIPIIYYGDEIGAQNNFENEKKSAELRKKTSLLKKIKLLSYFDSRDINRGSLNEQAFYEAKSTTRTFSGKIYHKVKQMIALRKTTPALSRGSLNILKTEKPYIFAYIRSYQGEKYLIVHNLANKRCVAEVELPADIILKSNKTGYVKLTNILNNQEFKIKVSIKERKSRLLMYPYAFAWLKLP